MREIESIGGFSSNTATRAVLGNCPGLVKLRCYSEDFPNHLEFVANHNKLLESLGLYTIKATNARFPYLKELVVWKAENIDHLIAFLMSNPTIESFKIHELEKDQLKGKPLEDLINKTGLKYVEICDKIYETLDVIYEEVKRGFGTWKTLILGENFRFTFPENPEDW